MPPSTHVPHLIQHVHTHAGVVSLGLRIEPGTLAVSSNRPAGMDGGSMFAALGECKHAEEWILPAWGGHATPARPPACSQPQPTVFTKYTLKWQLCLFIKAFVYCFLPNQLTMRLWSERKGAEAQRA